MVRRGLCQCAGTGALIHVNKKTPIKNGILSGEKIYPYIMSKNDTIDIDTEEDWKKADNYSFNSKGV